METRFSFTELVQRFKSGDPQAAEQVYTLYVGRLTRLAEQHLSRKLAGRMDGDDVVQSVFRTFFRRNAEGEFQIDSSGQLWRLLVQITLRKTWAKLRLHSADKRSVAAEIREGNPLWMEALAEGPSPLEAAVLNDEMETLLCGLPSLYEQILRLRLEGNSAAEIAPQLRVSRRTVYRALETLKNRLLAREKMADSV